MFQRKAPPTAAERTEGLQAHSAAQRERLAAAQARAEDLAVRWAAACLAADVDGAQNSGEIAAIEADQAAAQREILRAESAIAELSARLETARRDVLHEAYVRDAAELASLVAQNSALTERYSAAALALVDAAAALGAHNRRLAELKGSIERWVFSPENVYGDGRQPYATAGVPAFYVHWLTDLRGPEDARRHYDAQ